MDKKTQTAPNERIPVEVFHPSEYIIKEMVARDWSRDRLASAMCVRMSDEEFGVNRLALDLYLDVGPDDADLLIDADAFARAFGMSRDFWQNLEAAWRRKQ